jgi:uncharacterized protein
MHAVQSIKDADKILAPGGAMEAALDAQKNGFVRYIGISGHGKPDALIHSIKKYPYNVLMNGFNYFDRFNYFPQQDELITECQNRGIGLIGMKALADGYLYRSVEQGIRFSLSLPITTLVLGINTRAYLQQDLAIANNFELMTDNEKEELYTNAQELGKYVCRQCKKCDGKTHINPSDIFLLEGEFDRQMEDGWIPDPAEYALRERLKHWFAQNENASKKYRQVEQVKESTNYCFLNEFCPYQIDIDRKLKLAHSKLSLGEFVF